uniref:Uncharacterized protein n=1 Tax=Anguilla anguilla TaxID=7936 RepID=A0A0E9QS28_ANGAN
MRLLGMVGYYWGFCENLSTVVAPLTNLLRGKFPSAGRTNVKWLLNWQKPCFAVRQYLLLLVSIVRLCYKWMLVG